MKKFLSINVKWNYDDISLDRWSLFCVGNFDFWCMMILTLPDPALVTKLPNVLLFVFCMRGESITQLSHCHSPLWPMTHDVQGPPHIVSAGNVRLICWGWARFTTESVACCQTCHGDIRQTVLTPLAPLQSLFSLLQAFPQGGALGASESLDRRQCQIRWGQVSRGDLPLLMFFFSDSYIFPCAFTRGSNYYVRPSLVRWDISEWWPSWLSDLSNVGPADIDVVAALGDHTVSGTAALANSTSDTFKDFPEVSFAMGLWKWWRTSYWPWNWFRWCGRLENSNNPAKSVETI